MTSYPHLAQRLFNTPLALHPGKAEVVMAALADRFGVAHIFNGGSGSIVAYNDDGFEEFARPARARDSGYEVVGGVAVIEVTGTLVKKLGRLTPFSGMTGYDGIRQNFVVAMNDPNVEAIVLDIDSGGGEVAGCLDLVDTIYGARGAKPIWAILSEAAYSAAYALASAADRIIVPRTGGTGSVGVVYMHVDMSKALSGAGLTVTFVHYGDQKVDGNEALPLSERALKKLQSDVDATGDMLVATVARNRGLSVAAVRATQAGTYLGAQGVAVGFADAVMAPDAAFADLLATLG